MTPEQDLQNQLLRYYREQIPAVKNPEIVDFAYISDGWENQVYAYTLEHNGGQDARILRIYPGDDATARSQQEFAGMRTLFEQGYPVPEVFLYETDRRWLGDVFVIMQKIDGPLMGDVMDTSPPEREKALIRRFAQLYVDLHRLDIEPFLPAGAPAPDSHSVLDGLFAQGKALLDGGGHHELDAALDWFIARREDIPCERVSITHGDFHFYNVILDSSEHPFVIDWTQIMPGDYRLDLAWTLLLAGGYGRPHRRDLLLAEYERIAGKPVEAAFKRLGFIYLSLVAGAEAMGLRPEANDLIRQKPDHIQHVYAQLKSVTGLTLPDVERVLESLA
jgi:aminoglycoside phosphotransferase (APT) family kinase protein